MHTEHQFGNLEDLQLSDKNGAYVWDANEASFILPAVVATIRLRGTDGR